MALGFRACIWASARRRKSRLKSRLRPERPPHMGHSNPGLISATEVGRWAHPGGARRQRFPGCIAGRAAGVRCKRGELRGHAAPAAGGTRRFLRCAVAHQPLESRSAIVAQVFKNRHESYSSSAVAILSIHWRTAEGGAEKLLTRIEKASAPCALLSA